MHKNGIQLTNYILGKTGLLLDSQHPEGWEKVKSLESRAGHGRLEVEDLPVGPPHFVTELMVRIQKSNKPIIFCILI